MKYPSCHHGNVPKYLGQWYRNWTPVMCKSIEYWLENLLGQRSLAGYSPSGCKESTRLSNEVQHMIYPDAGKDWRQEKETTKDEMAGWHHRLNGCEFEQTSGDSEGHGSLACCSPWGRKMADRHDLVTEQRDILHPSYSISSLHCLFYRHTSDSLKSFKWSVPSSRVELDF